MKILHITVACFGLALVVGCTNHDKGSSLPAAPAPAPTTQPPKALDTGTTDLGSVDGKPGGVCRPEIVSEFSPIAKECAAVSSLDEMGQCQKDGEAFSAKHPGLNCVGELPGGGTVKFNNQKPTAPAPDAGPVKADPDQGQNDYSPAVPAPKPVVKPAPSIPAKDLCRADVSAAFEKVSAACQALNETSPVGQWRQCSFAASAFLDKYPNEHCTKANSGVKVSTETVQHYSDDASFNIFEDSGN